MPKGVYSMAGEDRAMDVDITPFLRVSMAVKAVAHNPAGSPFFPTSLRPPKPQISTIFLFGSFAMRAAAHDTISKREHNSSDLPEEVHRLIRERGLSGEEKCPDGLQSRFKVVGALASSYMPVFSPRWTDVVEYMLSAMYVYHTIPQGQSG
ncbi:uncharacterized protein MCYG_00383 [Microsporum canis CBS 113480]|uniref:Uncharacterized protein n=1 Tax=Arthroderma otae (strain ATCC MYA-4605 / CBS 113480) TaxID=554155 RepID=C5FC72_ARTOC|nr:uncharacterized protein MCYG_00383 [Microsporum canis CBS 113480]EEQ27495.1 predicted protein [Microsporum canis CBS 113480]